MPSTLASSRRARKSSGWISFKNGQVTAPEVQVVGGGLIVAHLEGFSTKSFNRGTGNGEGVMAKGTISICEFRFGSATNGSLRKRIVSSYREEMAEGFVTHAYVLFRERKRQGLVQPSTAEPLAVASGCQAQLGMMNPPAGCEFEFVNRYDH